MRPVVIVHIPYSQSIPIGTKTSWFGE